VKELEHVHRILSRGTSAHRQLALRKRLLADGLTEAEANRRLIEHLIDETASGVQPAGSRGGSSGSSSGSSSDGAVAADSSGRS
jgi:hypothetical protein